MNAARRRHRARSPRLAAAARARALLGRPPARAGGSQLRVRAPAAALTAHRRAAARPRSAARDARTGERVAIKKIANPFAVPLEAKRLLREICLLRRLRHPNIIAIKARATHGAGPPRGAAARAAARAAPRRPRARVRRAARARCRSAVAARRAAAARARRALLTRARRSRRSRPAVQRPPQEILRPSDALSFRDLYLVYELMDTDLYQARARRGAARAAARELGVGRRRHAHVARAPRSTAARRPPRRR